MKDIIRVTEPDSFVEIGVGKGETLKSYLNIAENYTDHVEYFGFDTFSQGPPEDETSHLNQRIEDAEPGSDFWRMHHSTKEYIQSIPDEYDVDCDVQLFKGRTEETLTDATAEMSPVDIIYIDGGHSYDTVRHDYENVKNIIKHSDKPDNSVVPVGTQVVFDDLNCEPGVTKCVSELLEKEKDPEFNDVMFTPSISRSSACITTVFSF
jgi:hypothetical protein